MKTNQTGAKEVQKQNEHGLKNWKDNTNENRNKTKPKKRRKNEENQQTRNTNRVLEKLRSGGS